MGNMLDENFKSNTILAYPPWKPSTSILSKYIIGTPSILFNYMKSPYFKSIDTIILDEIDYLLDSSANKHIIPMIKYMKNHISPLQFIFSGATVSFQGKKSPGIILQKLIPDLNVIQSSLDHTINKKLTIKRIEVNSIEEKKTNLLNLLKTCEYKSILIFVNEVKSILDLEQFFKDNNFDIPYLVFSKTDLAHVKEEKIKSFLENKIRILISTDILSRGLDTTNVDCVIQYDFAKDIISYTHRCGRTGRKNNEGTVINYVDKNIDNIFLKELNKLDQNDIKIDTLFSRKRRLNKKNKKELKDKKEEIYKKNNDHLKPIEYSKPNVKITSSRRK